MEQELNATVTEQRAMELTGYKRTSLFMKRKSGELPFERDHLTGRLSYKVADLLNLGKTR